MRPFFRFRPFDHPRERVARLQRLGLGLFAAAALAVWNPAERPGPTLCLLRHACALPCPLCGLTRGVALCLRCQPVRGSHYNPLAVPFLVLAGLLAARWAVEYWADRRLVVACPRWLRRALWGALYAALLAAWVQGLVYRREDDFASSWLGRVVRLFS
jgi:hypothetical protein